MHNLRRAASAALVIIGNTAALGSSSGSSVSLVDMSPALISADPSVPSHGSNPFAAVNVCHENSITVLRYQPPLLLT